MIFILASSRATRYCSLTNRFPNLTFIPLIAVATDANALLATWLFKKTKCAVEWNENSIAFGCLSGFFVYTLANHLLLTLLLSCYMLTQLTVAVKECNLFSN